MNGAPHSSLTWLQTNVGSAFAPSSARGWAAVAAALFFLLFLADWALFHPGFSSPMIYDSQEYIANRAHVFARGRITDVLSIVPSRPLFMLSLYVNYLVTGMDPYSFRLVNSAFLAAASVMLVVVALLVFRSHQGQQSVATTPTTIIALVLGFLFAFHPLQACVVLYVWQRSAIMACFFYFSALAAYLAARLGCFKTPFLGYGLTGLALLAGMMSKESCVTVPVILLLAELTLFGQDVRGLVKRGIIIAAITGPAMVLYLVITQLLFSVAAGTDGGAITGLRDHYRPVGWSFLEVALTQARVVFEYLRMIVAPIPDGLALIKAETVSRSLVEPQSTLFAVSGILGLTALGFVLVRRVPVCAFGILFFLIALIPESLLIPQYLFFGHRPILPMFGLLLVVGWWSLRLIGRVTVYDDSRNDSESRWGRCGGADGLPLHPHRAQSRLDPDEPSLCRVTAARSRRVGQGIAAGIALLAVGYLAAVTHAEARNWNPLLFWRDAYGRLPRLSENVELLPYLDIVTSYSGELIRVGKYGEALEALRPLEGVDATSGRRDSPSLRNKAVGAMINRGMALRRSGRVPEAIDQFRRVLAVNPKSAIAHNNLGLALEQTGDPAAGREHYRTAAHLVPQLAEPHFNLGNSLLKTGDVAGAIGSLQSAVRIRPDYAEALANLGAALLTAGRAQEAVVNLERAVKVIGANADLFNALGVAYAEVGRTDRAVDSFSKALALQPFHDEAKRNLEDLTRGGN